MRVLRPLRIRDRRPGALALLAIFAGLATIHLWPMPSDPGHLTRLDNNDTAFNTWVIAWVAHQLGHDPLNLFQAPIFYPARDTLAFSEHMVVVAALSAPLLAAGLSPVLVYNLMVWAGFALSGFAMALLLRSWTGGFAAAVVGGAAYAFNAHLLTRYAHLQALHVEFFPIALYAFDRVLRSGDAERSRDTRVGVTLGLAFVVQALCSNYTMVMMTLALAAGFLVRPAAWRRPRTWAVLTTTGAAAALLLLPFLLPYLRVRDEQGLVRTIDDVRVFSVEWTDYLSTAGRLHYDWWSHQFFTGRTLFPGIVASGLAAVAVATGAAWTDPRARMAAAFGLAGFALSFGTALPGYEWAHANVPLLQGIRAVDRWGWLFLVAIAVLAAFGTARIERRWATTAWWPFTALALVTLVTVEALRAPIDLTRFDGIPAVHARLAREDVRAMVVFPLYFGDTFSGNAPYLLHQTRHWRPMLNGYSSAAPASFHERAVQLQRFPAPEAIREMREIGITHIVLHRAPLEQGAGAPAIDALRTHPDLELDFEEDGLIVYRLR